MTYSLTCQTVFKRLPEKMSQYEAIPKYFNLPREVLKWLLSLDLQTSLKNIKREFRTGTVVAEILYWYYPKMCYPAFSYNISTSSEKVATNWRVLTEMFKKLRINIPLSLVNGTQYSKEGAAELLACKLYTLLTNRKLEILNGLNWKNLTFNDKHYQDQLPFYARATAAYSISKHINVHEINTKNPESNLKDVDTVLHAHYLQRYEDREHDPKRFGIKPTLGQRAPRKKVARTKGQFSTQENDEYMNIGGKNFYTGTSIDKSGDAKHVQHVHINVQQKPKHKKNKINQIHVLHAKQHHSIH